jgi:Tfp pilus assembly protein PilN
MFLLKKKPNKKEGRDSGFLQNPKILDVNLVKDEVQVSFDWRKNLLVLALVLALAALFVGEIYFGLDQWEKQEALLTKTLEDQADYTNAEVSKLKKQIGAALVYKEKSAVFSGLLDNHVYWTNFFSWLEKNTLSSVKYEQFSGGLDGLYTLSATAKTYADVSWQVRAFLKAPFVEKVQVVTAESTNTGQEGNSDLNFKITLKVKPEIFKK